MPDAVENRFHGNAHHRHDAKKKSLEVGNV